VCKSKGYAFEIICIDDGSTDDSAKIFAGIQGITVPTNDVNRGYGAALRAGLDYCSQEWVFITDADGTYPLEDLVHLLEARDQLPRGQELRATAAVAGLGVRVEQAPGVEFASPFQANGGRVPYRSSRSPPARLAASMRTEAATENSTRRTFGRYMGHRRPRDGFRSSRRCRNHQAQNRTHDVRIADDEENEILL